MTSSLISILKVILENYHLPLNGFHGISHWARVFENGCFLAEKTGANREVVELFAILHDSKRVNENSDPEHGPRAAEFALSLRGSLLHLSDDDFELLSYACAGHTHERTHPDITIQTCWDSDRLDLPRVGVQIDPYFLSTAIARKQETIRWATRKSMDREVPKFVKEEWCLDIG